MHPTLEQLLEQRPVVLDGAWGTELQRLGLPQGKPPEAWNLERPEAVASVAKAYVEAGSQIILTNTFGGNRFRLEPYGLADRVREINRLGAEISRRAAAGKAKVFGSIGPSGKLLLMKQVEPAQLEQAFAEQVEGLVEGGVDGLVIETMSDLQEALIALRIAKQTSLPVVACMVFDSGRDKDRTMMGNTPEQVAQALTEAGADVVGSNCGQGIAGFLNICRRLRAATTLPVWIKANAGLPQVHNGRISYETTPEEFASFIPKLIEAGADFVGGCCGTTPEFIRKITELYRS